MDVKTPVVSLLWAWTGTFFSFAVDHLSVIVGILSGVAATIASLYTIRTARKGARLRDLQIQEEEERLKQLRTSKDPEI